MYIIEKEFRLAEFKRFHERIDPGLPFNHEELNSFLMEEIFDDRHEVVTSWVIFNAIEDRRKNTTDKEKLQFFAKVEEQLFASNKYAFTNDW